MSSELITTLGPYGIGTSFSKDVDYFVSTAESPPHTGRYETLVKVRGATVVPICIVVSNSPKQATVNHIAMARMAISTNREDWNVNALSDFSPNNLVALLSRQPDMEESSSLESSYCDTLLRMSGLNYPTERLESGKPSAFHMGVYLVALAVGGKYGWQYGYDTGGMLVGIVLAILGAVITSTIVGVIARLFGYRP